MNPTEILEELLETARFITTQYLSDLSFDEMCLSPAEGANPIAWQLGHLVVSEMVMTARLSQNCSISLPFQFEELHQKPPRYQDSLFQPQLDLIRKLFGKNTYLLLLESSRRETLSFLRTLTPKQLKQPAPEEMVKYAKNWSSVFVMIGTHEVQHSGQLAVLRRGLGKSVLI